MTYPGSWQHCESPQAAQDAIRAGFAVVCSVDVALSPGVNRARVAAVWVQGPEGAGADVGAINATVLDVRAVIRAARGPQHPICAYVDAGEWRQTDGDYLAVQCYAEPSEDIYQALARFRRNIGAAAATGKRVVIVAQAFDRNGTELDLDKVAALQFWWPRLANEFPAVIGILGFAFNRRGGLRDHPDWQLVHQAIAASLTPPAIETIGEPTPPVEAPRVTILDTWGPRTGPAPLIVTVPVELSGGPATTLTVWADGRPPIVITNPPAGVSNHTHMFDRAGTYLTGARVEGPGGKNQTQQPRPVTVTAAEETPVATPTQYDEGFVKGQIKSDINADYREAGRVDPGTGAVIIDDDFIVWGARSTYDQGAGGLTKEASWKKHRNEMRGALGLPPFP